MELTDTTPAFVVPRATFTVCLSSTRRGARLARRLTAERLVAWGIPYDTETSHAASMVVAELAVNAVTHGRLPGRDFRLSLVRHSRDIRIEVTDTRPERLPQPPGDVSGSQEPGSESGRGLLLVAAYAATWGCESREPHTKTVWAEIDTMAPTM